MRKTVVLNVVGLTPALMQAQHMPRLRQFADQGRWTSIGPVIPAVTCPVQATYLTGTLPREHGIVANGWYDTEECQVKFWRQSNQLVQKPKLWDAAKRLDSSFTCANLFWWFNMYSAADFSVTPRPIYTADGRKLPDIYTHPADLRDRLQQELGTFPLFHFWGPAADIRSSRWIAEAAKRIEQWHAPTLQLIYLPHLDYALQRLGPDSEAIYPALAEIDQVCGDLIDFFTSRQAQVIVLSEYGIQPVNRPIHLNRLLRRHGLLQVRREQGGELLDAGASRAFAVADHQIAHVYLNDPTCLDQVRRLLVTTPGVARVLDSQSQKSIGLDHPRSGQLVALAENDSWFTYYYWLEDAQAPEFARMVEIHRKPGYDPAELFIDPALRFPKLKIAGILARKFLHLRYLMKVIPLDGSLVKGSHGVAPRSIQQSPLLITSRRDIALTQRIAPTQVYGLLLDHLQSPRF